MVADDALLQQYAMAYCACKMTVMLTRETSELTGLDFWPPNRMAFQTSAVTVLLCCFLLARIEYEIQIFTLTLY